MLRVVVKRAAAWQSALSDAGLRVPSGSAFDVLQHDTDGGGGGRVLFEVVDSLRSNRKLRAESVVIAPRPQPWQHARPPRRLGATVCVSSQAGCALDCGFCDTGLLKPASNLPAWAIVQQVHAARQLNPDIRRVVFMGMGEPLMNYTEVSRAIAALRLDEDLSRPWAITVSTVGVSPRMPLLAADHPEVALAVSLHAPSQALRARLVPAGAARWPLPEVMRAARAHEEAVGRVPMFAYIVLPGVNDGTANAQELAHLLAEGRPPGAPRPFVNLVPYNPTAAGEAHGYVVPSAKELRDFRVALRAAGVRATVRWSTLEGREVGAACGQLAGQLAESENSRKPVERSRVEGAPAERDSTSPEVLTRRMVYIY